MSTRSHHPLPGIPAGLRRGSAIPLLLLAAALSCSKKGGGGNPVSPPTTATATVMGIALGTGGLPLAGAVVSATPSAGVTGTSNSFGWFSLKVPANTPVSVTASHPGFADHPVALELATGDTRALTFVLAPLGATRTFAVTDSGQVVDPDAKTVLTLHPDFTSGTSFAFVSVTGIDPLTTAVLAMPGTIAAENSLGTLLNVEPATAAEVRIGDGADADFPLIQPATLEMHLPDALASSPSFGVGDAVPCFRYDDAAGRWEYAADGHVAISSLDGQKCIQVTITHLSWYLAGFLAGSAGCVSGHVFDGGAPVAGVTVQAFPGGIDVTKADGTYRVSAPVDAPVQIVATRPRTGTVTYGAASTTGGSPGGLCTDQPVTITPAGPPPTFVIAGQLIHGRDDALFVRDKLLVSVQTASPSAPVDGCVVQVSDGTTTTTLPLTSPGLYSAITGSQGAIPLQAGHPYTLKVDLEPDGHFDAIATTLMPGQPTIDAPTAGEVVNPTFHSSWNDAATGGIDSVIYIGSFTSDAFGTTPSRFALHAPANSFDVGTGVGQPQFFMPNDSLQVGGSYTFRLWATNGPVRYPVGTNLIFTTPNVAPTTPGGADVIGWFSAISQADSVKFTSLGSGERPGLAMRTTRRAR